jgi:colanic acid biosynthesis glycosyl transferase WcaI
VQVVRCPLYVPREPAGFRRIVHLASFALSALVPLLRARRPELVIAIAPALLGVFTAWLAARLKGARLWIHVQDFEVEAALATGLMRKGVLTRLAAGLERWLLRRADRVSAISPQMCARLAGKGVAAERIFELRNWADDRFAPDPAGAELLRAKWGLEGRTVALYSGNLARKQGVEILVEAARRLAHRGDIAFVICGEGPSRARLEAAAGGLPNLQFHDLQPTGQMGAMLAMADLHLLPQIAGAADLVLPSKLTNMLASARPVIATAAAGTGLAAEVEGCGAVIPPGDAAALAEAILALADAPAKRRDLGQAASRRAAERWHKATIIDTLEAEIARLLG